MNENEAITLARQYAAKRGLELGIPISSEFHPEGGQSLPNFESISYNDELRTMPYWKFVFPLGGVVKLAGRESEAVNAIVFSEERLLIQPITRPGTVIGLDIYNALVKRR